MTSHRTLSTAAAEAGARVGEFKGFFRLALAVEALLALALLTIPTVVEAAFALPPDYAWSLVGALWLWSVVFQAPGLADPENARLPVVIGVVGRYGVALACAALSIWAFAALALLFALTLSVLYHRMVISALMSRP